MGREQMNKRPKRATPNAHRIARKTMHFFFNRVWVRCIRQRPRRQKFPLSLEYVNKSTGREEDHIQFLRNKRTWTIGWKNKHLVHITSLSLISPWPPPPSPSQASWAFMRYGSPAALFCLATFGKPWSICPHYLIVPPVNCFSHVSNSPSVCFPTLCQSVGNSSPSDTHRVGC